MTAKRLPDRDLLSQLFRYDPVSGDLIWRERPKEHFGTRNAETLAKGWNSKFAGTRAGRRKSGGYMYIRVFGSVYLSHRLIWKMHHGDEPPLIDHIDRNPLNNRIENLRPSNHSLNMINASLMANNTSGHTGVSWHKRDRVWCANIRVDGKLRYLGAYPLKADAVKARKAAEVALGI